ncbi:hypothetical protein [Bradyrhizobium sp. Rc2d]|uniref:hypothetical protein n=1 Tax=Bradyrhizobium sp. Rc2d TaxID=1855321 RepID=UPI0015A02188|nr:hypothetical protein [Bradyrhizobium sp. Rc2d]
MAEQRQHRLVEAQAGIEIADLRLSSMGRGLTRLAITISGGSFFETSMIAAKAVIGN